MPKKKTNKELYGKRGMVLESYIDQANTVYNLKGLALIHKEPTPWNVSYNKRTGKVYRAFPEKKGAVDFLGVSHGRAIAFDSKATNELTRFPLKNVEAHQVDYLLKHQDQGGISFLIIGFMKKNEVYYLPIDDFLPWWEASLGDGRKSIPYEWMMMNAELVKPGHGVALDWLAFCNTAYKGKEA